MASISHYTCNARLLTILLHAYRYTHARARTRTYLYTDPRTCRRERAHTHLHAHGRHACSCVRRTPELPPTRAHVPERSSAISIKSPLHTLSHLPFRTNTHTHNPHAAIQPQLTKGICMTSSQVFDKIKYHLFRPQKYETNIKSTPHIVSPMHCRHYRICQHNHEKEKCC